MFKLFNNEKLSKIVESKNLNETVICQILSQIIVKIDIIMIQTLNSIRIDAFLKIMLYRTNITHHLLCN